MCGGKPPDPTPPPATPLPAPVASPIPSDVSPAQTAQQRRAQVSSLKFGAISTIRNPNGAQGITGNGADLSNANSNVSGQKKTLGS
jgi:hypothetical protein